MPQPTRIIGPYDQLTTDQKFRIHFGVPKNIVKDMFTDIIPYRGAQDKICARLFHLFYTELLTRYPNIHSFSDEDKENVINELLNDYATTRSNTTD